MDNYSKLLQIFLNRATVRIPNFENYISVEGFLYAVLSVYDGTALEIANMDDFAPVNGFINRYILNPQKLKAILSEYINGEGTSRRIYDNIIMNNMLVLLCEEVKGREITVNDVLICIFSAPTPTVSNCMKEKKIVDQKRFEDDYSLKEDVFFPWYEIREFANERNEIAKLTKRVKIIQRNILSEVLGQDNAVSVAVSGYFQAKIQEMTQAERKKPFATYLFAGPPGVGKTFLAQRLAKELGDIPFVQFDMSEYCDREAVVEFCGSDGVYRNGKEGNFTKYVSKNQSCVVLFDEIEKAHSSIIHLFLQMLDEGRIRDNYTDKEISLKNVIMIFTTNAGKQLYNNRENGDFSVIPRKVILKALENDINPITKEPYFPAAICSRFASGNVVMFNHIGGAELYRIAKKTLDDNAEHFEKKFGIKVEIDPHVATAILLNEGGNLDARAVTGRAASFFNNELFELFRLTCGREGCKDDISQIEKICISLELGEAEDSIREMFASYEEPGIIVFASEDMVKLCEEKYSKCQYFHVGSVDNSDAILRKNDIKAIFIDINYHSKTKEKKCLNIEDIDSRAKRYFDHIKEVNSDIPVYLLQTVNHTFDDEERTSFKRQGVKGVLTLSDSDTVFSSEMDEVCLSIHQQQILSKLARANKLVSFNTAQYLEKQGCADIKLESFKMETAVDAEDKSDILSNISKPNVGFDDVIGASEAKSALYEFVGYLKNPKKYFGTGAKPPRGVLLYGPPGTGKTMLAKALACESDVTFITAEGNQFLKKYMGEGAETVHELFKIARKYAPSILFIDEIDAIGAERQGGEQRGYDAVLTALLTEMDGFKNNVRKPVFVLAATNYDIKPNVAKSLDQALLRRFDRRIYVELPNCGERERYLKKKISENGVFKVSEYIIKNIAVRSAGMSLAHLESVLEMSLRSLVIDEGSTFVNEEILEEAFETVSYGGKKEYCACDLKRTAVHEAGHAVMCLYGGDKPAYVTVVSRGTHGGYTQQTVGEDKTVYTKKELLSKIRVFLGGRAAELVYYGDDGLSTGARADLISATNLARSIVCSYGMIENFGLAVIDLNSPIGKELSKDVFCEVNRILSRELETAVEVIKNNKAAIDVLVSRLEKYKCLSSENIEEALKAETLNF